MDGMTDEPDDQVVDPYAGVDPFTALLCKALQLDPSNVSRIEYVMDGEDYPASTVLVHLIPPFDSMSEPLKMTAEMYRWSPINPVSGRRSESFFIKEVVGEMKAPSGPVRDLIRGMADAFFRAAHKHGYMVIKDRRSDAPEPGVDG